MLLFSGALVLLGVLLLRKAPENRLVRPEQLPVAERRAEIRRIMTLCTGNLCRSPMAEGMLRERLRTAGRPDITVTSAGLIPWEGRPACELAVKVCRAVGVDIAGHRSTPIVRPLAEEADLILVMEKRHYRFIARRFPDARRKVVMLGAFDPEAPGSEIPDPIGEPLEIYLDVRERIRRCVDGVVGWLGDYRAGPEAGGTEPRE